MMPGTTDAARVTLLGVPSDVNSSFLRGPSLAPARIREALGSPASHLVTETGTDLDAEEALGDAGDLPVAGLGPEDADAEIEAAVGRLLDAGTRLVCLGGDHAVTNPVVRAHAARIEGLNILHVDAHPDLYDRFEGNPLSHASPFARIMETGRIARLVQVGIRTLNPHLREQAARFGVEVHEMRDWPPAQAVSFDGPVYLSVDLDGLDPAFAPGVSHREPGGLSTRDVIALIQKTGGRFVGGDVVELNPHRDLGGVTAVVAAKLVKELCARVLQDLD